MSLRIGIGLGLIPTAARPSATTAPVNVDKPFFAGILTQGQSANVNPGGWTGLPSANFTYAIKRGAATVSTDPAYVWTSADVAAGAGAMTVAVTATNDVGPTTASSDPVTIAAPLQLAGSAPSAIVGALYSFTPSRTGGHGPYTFALTGTLPTGLSFSTSTGAITGTPVASGTASLGIGVTDADGLTTSLGPFDLTVTTAFQPTGLIALGDSRIQLSGGMTAGTSFSQNQGNGAGYGGILAAELDNALATFTGYNFGVTSQTSKGILERITSALTAVTGPTDAGRNPAYDITNNSADSRWSVAAAGDYSPVAHPGNIVFFMGMVNDLGKLPFFTGPLKSMQNAAAIFDAMGAAGKVVFAAETPKGKSTVWLESRTVASGAFTAANTTGFKGAADWDVPASELITSTGVVLTKVASAPGPGQYSVTSGGIYTVDAGLNGASVFITYSYGAGGQTTADHRALNNWLKSASPAPFVDADTGTPYAIAGARYARPWVKYVDAWGVLVDPATGDMKAGVSNDGLHPGRSAVKLVAEAFKTAFRAAFPEVTASRAKLPTKNNIEVAQAGAATLNFASGIGSMVPLAGSMLVGPPSELRFTYGAGAGAGPTVINCVDLGNGYGRLTGPTIDASKDGGTSPPTGNFVNLTTGAWNFWVTTTPGNLVRIYAERDPTNVVTNALFQTDMGAGAKSAELTGNPPKNWTISGDTGTRAAITAGTLSVAMSVGVDPETGAPALFLDINGMPGTGVAVTCAATNLPLVNRLNPAAGENVVAGAKVKILPGANGKLYGLYSAHVNLGLGSSAAVNRTPSFPAVTATGAVVQVGASGFSMTDAELRNGAIDFVALSPPVDISGMTISSFLVQLVCNFMANKPVSARVMFSSPFLQKV